MDVFGGILWVRERQWIGYTLAVIGPVLGILLRFALGRALVGFPFVTFFPPILIAAILGGRLSGTIATILCGVLADYFLIEPYGLRLPWPVGWIAMTAFVAVAATMILFIDFAISAAARLSKAMSDLRALNERLEQRVAERTRELTMLAAQLRDEIATKEAAQAQIIQMQKMQAIGQLSSGIAHDFNNMLSIIVGSLDVIGRRLDQGRTDVIDLLENAKDGAKRAATLTHQLLAFSRKQPLTPTTTDVNTLVASLSELLRHALGEDISLECVLGAGLWRISVDPNQLENAILNLAVNARDAMPIGGKLTIETQNAFLDDTYAKANDDVAAGDYVLVALTDTGTGMPTDIVARVFEPFFTTKGEGRGTGLGLSQVYGFIKQSGGHVKIYSEVGHGTTVKTYWPRHAGDPALPAPGRSAPQKTAVPMGSPTEIILVVDDDDAVRDIHATMLLELNYSVLTAAGGREALAVMRRRQDIALLFTDVVMPEMSGSELAEQTKTIRPDLKVLYTTGYTANAVVHNGVVDPGVDLLPKPFFYDQLARKIRSMLDRP